MSLRRKYETEGGTKDLLNALDVTLIRYRFPLRRGLTVNLWFPEDMTEAEAERVAGFAHALAMKKGPPWSRTPSRGDESKP
jgi:hypothetical protein